MQNNARLLPISCNFHVMLLLANVQFPSEYCQTSGKPLVSLMVSNKNSYFTMACRAFHAYNLQWYHISIILPANNMITQLQKLWILYYIPTQY